MRAITNIHEPERSTPVVSKVDVLVAGAGTAGFAAALSAARHKADVLVIERYGFVGGMCTAGYVPLLPTWNLVPWKNELSPLIGGIASEIVARLDQIGASILAKEAKRRQVEKPILPYWPTWFQFDFEGMKIVMLKMLREAGVKIRLHSYIADVIKENNMVKGLIVESKSGRQAFLADVVIDATGDGDVAALSGANYELASKSSIKPMTLTFYVGNVEHKKAIQTLAKDPGLKKTLKEKAEDLFCDTKGPLKVPASLMLSYVDIPKKYADQYVQLTRNREWFVWGAHVSGKHSVNADDLTDAEIDSREKVEKIVAFLKAHVPGFENCYISSVAPQIGIRESRRVIGGYQLTGKDVLKGSRFHDVIVRSRTGELELTNKMPHPPFDIPYRCIIPKMIDNILVAGRCISIDHIAASYFSPRDISTCMALGEASGTAAALSLREKISPRHIDVSMLQKSLIKQGMNLG